MNKLATRDQKLIWHPYTQSKIAPAPIVITRGSGSYLFTDTDKKLFDGISSWWTNAHGHCNPYISQAINEQLNKLEHVIFASFTHEPAVKLAELLVKAAPAGLARVFYSDNGSTAVEVALKMAYQYWHHQKQHRPYFIALEHSYHGDTFGAMSVSERGIFTKPFWPLLFDVIKTKSPCISQVTKELSAQIITERALENLAETLSEYRGQIAGMIIEPMLQAAGGMRIFTPGFLSGIRKLCDEEGILLIADEVATGFYRTGTYFASHHENSTPDIMCVAKGLTGGFLPLAATLATEKIFQAFMSDSKADALLHGHSFTGNPLACAAAVASLELFQQGETQQNIKDICCAIASGMEQFNGLSTVKNTRSLGTIAIIELADPQGGYVSVSAEKIYQYCFERGLYIRPLGNLVYLMPPLCTTKIEIEWALGLIKEAIIADSSYTNHKAPSYGW
jgi:adenosylmethionine---8-amino-7-oxononanoate aminotransferase